MPRAEAGLGEPLRIGTPLKLTFAIMLLLAVISGVRCNMAAIGHDPGRPDLADFNIFVLAGDLVWSGRLAEAYRMTTMAPLERALSVSPDFFMPWSYPPLFAAAMAPLAKLPLGVAQALFATSTLAFYLGVMHRLGRKEAWPILLATIPAIVINLRAGQNGLLTGGLLGSAALFLLAGKPKRAGAAIAALAIKPHLAAMLPVLLLLRRAWLTLAAAAAGAVVLTAASIVVVGPPVFGIFIGSFAEVGRLMMLGAYPLHRMTSIYAALLSWGAPSALAIVIHGGIAAAIVASTALMMRATADARLQIGLALTSTVFVSPYLYDYDQTVFGVGLMLLSPALARGLTPRSYGLVLLGVGIAQGIGIIVEALGVGVSLGGPLLLLLYGVILRTVRREIRRRAAAPALLGGFA